MATNDTCGLRDLNSGGVRGLADLDDKSETWNSWLKSGGLMTVACGRHHGSHAHTRNTGGILKAFPGLHSAIYPLKNVDLSTDPTTYQCK